MGLAYCKPDTSGEYKPWDVVCGELKAMEDEALAHGTLMEFLKIQALIANVNRIIEDMKKS